MRLASCSRNKKATRKKESEEIPIIKLQKKIANQNNISFEISNLNIDKYKNKMKFSNNKRMLAHNAHIYQSKRSNKTPFNTFDHSLRTLENALDASRDSIKHFIFLSSSMVYGNFKTSEVTEESVCEPIGIYGALKYAAEKIIIAYNQVFDLPYTILRPSALYGERCISRRVGQIFIENALFDKELLINGDGKEKLDFTYIEDLTNGTLNIINNKNSINQIFNLTYGEGREINEMVEILKKHFPKLKLKKKDRDNLMPYEY